LSQDFQSCNLHIVIVWSDLTVNISN
jgi:hypothetical protein